MERFENIIIGSGPSGTLTSKLISDSGKSVLMLDIGYDTDDKLNFDKPKQNFYENLKKYNTKTKNYKNYKNSNIKFPFGSDYVYKKNFFEDISCDKKLDFVLSNSFGGLSNIWANLVSPFKKIDINDWPISYEEFYKSKYLINNIIPINQNSDFDDYFETQISESKSYYDISDTGKKIISTLNKNKVKINDKGLFFGRSISSISNKFSKDNTDCLMCGLCHFGCPNNNMFSSVFLLKQLISRNNFKYQKNSFVSKILNNKSLEVIDINTQEKKIYHYKNLFICSGALSTSMLILRSNLVKNNIIKLKESHRFFFPIINKSKPAIYERFKNTLPEIFFELYNQSLGNRSVHMQLYSLSEVMLKPFTKIFGNLGYKLPYLVPQMNRMNILLGYLHSDYSGKIVIKYIKEDKDSYHYNFVPEFNPQTFIKIKKIKEFLKDTIGNNFFFPNILNDNGIIGSSYHYGSSFPMSNKPVKNVNVDIDGCLNKDLSIHIFDSSIFPSMPGSPTTYNTLINIARILNKLSL